MDRLASPLGRLSWKGGVAIAALLAMGTALAASTDKAVASTRVPKPVIDAGGGEKCVEDTEFMRRNHMELLKHQRDKTVHDGIRTKQYSLNNCIECHASRKTNSVIGSNENFCQSCHSYAAVKLDCFECHASKPKTAAFHPLVSPEATPGALATSLRRQLSSAGAQP